jgi:hypothetical protein
MQTKRWISNVILTSAAIVTGSLPSTAQAPKAAVQVTMTVTLDVVGEGKRMPEVKREDVAVRQGKDRLRVVDWTAAQGGKSGLDLFILIDDACETTLGTQLNDIRTFIKAQGQGTSIGIGYMRNATVQIVQNFTNDLAAAEKAVRLPMANTGAYGSPYLSVIDLMKRWPQHPNRREVVMVTDGIDRARRGIPTRGLGPISPDVDTAISVAQRTGTIIHTIYFPGIGRLHHNFWEANNGQNGLAKLSDETGGESYFLGLQAPVSFKPYLDQIQTILNNQYLITFEANPGTKAALQPVDISTEVAGVEIAAANNVWVPTSNKPVGTGF